MPLNLKEIFDKAEGGVLTFAGFEEAVKSAGIKLVNLNDGEYVSKHKYDDDIAAKDSQITKLNGDITQRDADLKDLNSKLEAAGTDSTKLTQVQGDLTALQTKYEDDVKQYKAQLAQQAYEFAVKEFAATKNFTSNAARRDFINSMIAKNLTMDQGNILGAEDFVTAYTKDNSDAFVVDKTPEPTPEPAKPTFVNPTPGGNPSPTPDNGFINAFNFVGVRPKE